MLNHHRLPRLILLIIIPLSVSLVFLASCSLFSSDKKGSSPEEKEAHSVLTTFMEARLRGDEAAARKHLDPAALKQFNRLPGLRLSLAMSNPQPTGYVLSSPQTGVGDISFEVRTHLAYTREPWARFIDEDFTLARKNGTFKIVAAELLGGSEFIQEDGTLYEVRHTATASGSQRMLIPITALPETFIPPFNRQDPAAKVGREGFGPLAVSPDTKKLAFITRGTNGLLAMVEMESGTITPINLYPMGTGNRVLWTATSRFLAAEVTTGPGVRQITFYETSSGQPVRLGLSNRFPQPDYQLSLVRSQPSGDRIVFEVEAGDKKKADPEKIGLWEADLKNKQVKKLS